MSLPEFPTISPPLSREAAINQIISSIAMEELGLSHIINAEGEKLQYILGTIPGLTGPSATIEDVLKVNESVRSVLQGAAESQTLLRSKLQNALSSAVLTGPTGVTGPTGESGPATIAIGDVTKLEPDDQPTVRNTGPDGQNVTLAFGIPRGATGDTGPSTTAVNLSVQNDGGATITGAAGGTPIPFSTWKTTAGFAPNGDSTAFTIQNPGDYLVSYSIRATATLTGSSAAIFLGGTEDSTTKVGPADTDTFYYTGILELRTEAPLAVRLSGTQDAVLQSGVGAFLTAVRLT